MLGVCAQDHSIRPSKTVFDADGLQVDQVHALAPEEEGLTYVSNGGFLDPTGERFQTTRPIMKRRSCNSSALSYRAASGFCRCAGQLDMRDLPCPSVNVNFLPRDFTRLNGERQPQPGSFVLQCFASFSASSPL